MRSEAQQGPAQREGGCWTRGVARLSGFCSESCHCGPGAGQLPQRIPHHPHPFTHMCVWQGVGPAWSWLCSCFPAQPCKRARATRCWAGSGPYDHQRCGPPSARMLPMRHSTLLQSCPCLSQSQATRVWQRCRHAANRPAVAASAVRGQMPDAQQQQQCGASTLKQQVVLQNQLNLACRAVLVAPGACEHSRC